MPRHCNAACYNCTIVYMPELELEIVSPEEFLREIDNAVRQRQENKYAFQVGLEDLSFEIDEDKAKILGISVPLPSIGEAEQALRQRVIGPTTLVEIDDTEHQVIIFDPKPIGFSGFVDCAIHSLALTYHGLFEVGHYAAVNLVGRSPYWPWFLHRRLATAAQVAMCRDNNNLSAQEMMGLMFEAMTGKPVRPSGW